MQVPPPSFLAEVLTTGIPQDDGLVINCLTASQSAQFYDGLFATGRVPEKPELYNAVKPKVDREYVDPLWQHIRQILTDTLPRNALVVELGGGVYQQRSGFLLREFPH